MLPFILAIVTSLSVLGIGFYSINWCFIVWPVIWPLTLRLALAWLAGYTLVEVLLYVLAMMHLFYWPLVIFIPFILGAAAWVSMKPIFNISSVVPKINIQVMVLAGISFFVLFWNLYPTFDVDSLSGYFRILKNLFKCHGLHFDPYDDIRWSLPWGENLLYSIGFAFDSNQGIVFAQLIHGVSKVMVVLMAYGGARLLGLKELSLIPPILLASEEHFIASGANHNVHVNTHLLLGVSMIMVMLIVLWKDKQPRALVAALVGATAAAMCKFVGAAYAFFLFIIIGLAACWHPWCRRLLKDMWHQPRFRSLAAVLILGMFLPYVIDWIFTGSPISPSNLGPLVPRHYDAYARTLGAMYHYHLGVGAAVKNISAFMVWPGVLALKILLPLMIVGACWACFSGQPFKGASLTGLVLGLMAILMVVIQQNYIVYEMRYYRFVLVIASLSCACIISGIFETGEKRFQGIEKIWPWSKWCVVVLAMMISFKYSFSVMAAESTRPSARDIVSFLSHHDSVSDILKRNYPQEKDVYDQYRILPFDPSKTGILVRMSWPQTVYPLQGRNLSFSCTAALPSYVYFDGGSFAKYLLSLDIEQIIDLTTDRNYPLNNGSVKKVLDRCGQPMAGDSPRRWLNLSKPCLQEMATLANPAAGYERLEEIITSLRKKPGYDPFNTPGYGGVDKLLE